MSDQRIIRAMTRAGVLAGRLDEFLGTGGPVVAAWSNTMALHEGLAEAWLQEHGIDARSWCLYRFADQRPAYETTGFELADRAMQASAMVMSTPRGKEDFDRVIRKLKPNAAGLAEGMELIWERRHHEVESEGIPALIELASEWATLEDDLHNLSVGRSDALWRFNARGLPCPVTRMMMPWVFRRLLGTRHLTPASCLGVRRHAREWPFFWADLAKRKDEAVEAIAMALERAMSQSAEHRNRLSLLHQGFEKRAARGRTGKRDADMLAFALRQPIFDARDVEKALDLSFQGSIDIIGRAEQAGIVTMLTQRDRFRLWCCDRAIAGISP